MNVPLNESFNKPMQITEDSAKTQFTLLLKEISRKIINQETISIEPYLASCTESIPFSLSLENLPLFAFICIALQNQAFFQLLLSIIQNNLVYTEKLSELNYPKQILCLLMKIPPDHELAPILLQLCSCFSRTYKGYCYLSEENFHSFLISHLDFPIFLQCLSDFISSPFFDDFSMLSNLIPKLIQFPLTSSPAILIILSIAFLHRENLSEIIISFFTSKMFFNKVATVIPIYPEASFSFLTNVIIEGIPEDLITSDVLISSFQFLKNCSEIEQNNIKTLFMFFGNLVICSYETAKYFNSLGIIQFVLEQFMNFSFELKEEAIYFLSRFLDYPQLDPSLIEQILRCIYNMIECDNLLPLILRCFTKQIYCLQSLDFKEELIEKLIDVTETHEDLSKISEYLIAHL